MYEPQRTGGRVFNSVGRACERLDVGKTTLYALINAGKLKKAKVNGKTMVTEESIQNLLIDAVSAAMEAA